MESICGRVLLGGYSDHKITHRRGFTTRWLARPQGSLATDYHSRPICLDFRSLSSQGSKGNNLRRCIYGLYGTIQMLLLLLLLLYFLIFF